MGDLFIWVFRLYAENGDKYFALYRLIKHYIYIYIYTVYIKKQEWLLQQI